MESATNQIVAGNLDIELYHADAATGATATKVTNTTKLFDDVTPDLWEPGATAWEEFTVKNEGTLALKYQFSLNVANATVVNGVSFASKLQVAIVEDDDFDYTRANIEAIEDDAWSALASFTRPGNLAADKEETFGVIIRWAPTANDNDFNMNNGKAAGSVKVDVGVKLVATQLSAEVDGNGSDYDAGAYLPVVYTEAELQTALESNESVQLGGDITLNGAWTPIGDKDAGVYFTGTLDGNGHAIKGLNAASGDYVSLISAAKDATIKNLTVEGTVSGDNAAGIVARIEGKTVVDNCVNNVAVTGTTKAGGIVSNVTGAEAVIINCVNNGDVSCSNAKAGGVGGIIGYVNTNANVKVIGCVNNGNVVGTENQTTGAVIGYAAANSSGLIADFTNTGAITGKNYVGDGLGRWLEDENGLVLAGYCGTPANWAEAVDVSNADELKDVFESASDDKAVVLLGDVKVEEALPVKGDVLVDLNGYNMDASNAESAFKVEDNANLTINAKDEEIEVGASGLVEIPAGKNAVVEVNGGNFVSDDAASTLIKADGAGDIKVVLNDVNYTSTATNGYALDFSYYDGTNLDVEINGGSYEATTGMLLPEGSSVKGAEITAKNTKNMQPAVYAMGDMTIENCIIKADKSHAVAVAGGATLTVKDCEVYAGSDSGALAFQVFSSGGTIDIYNTTYEGGYGTTGKMKAGCVALIYIDGVEKYRKG